MLLKFVTMTYATENLKQKQTPNRHNSEAIRVTGIEKGWCSGRKVEAVCIRDAGGWSQRSSPRLKDGGVCSSGAKWCQLRLFSWTHGLPMKCHGEKAENKFITVQHTLMSSASCDTWYVTINPLKLQNGLMFYLIWSYQASYIVHLNVKNKACPSSED